MSNDEPMSDIFLMPGGFHFGGPGTRIRTVLGSCVSITLWHPVRRIGGMCHYMLARRPATHQRTHLDGKYGEDAIQLCLNAAKAHGVSPLEFEFKLFGAASMFSGASAQGSCVDGACNIATGSCPNVPCANARIARLLLAQNGLEAVAEDLGGESHRSLVFDIDSGRVWRRHAMQVIPKQARVINSN